MNTSNLLDEGVLLDDELTDSETNPAQQNFLGDYEATAADVGVRLDKLAATVFADFSRANLQKFIESGALRVNGEVVKAKYAIKAGDVLNLSVTLEQHSADLPENIAIDVVYCDDAVIVINKPANMVVHPGAGNPTGTLVNALLYHYPQQAQLPRAGLVHRIDKDTTGLLVVARNKSAQLALIEQLKDKSVYRHYQCVVLGAAHEVLQHGCIDAPIGRHPSQRTKMAVRHTGKPAVTYIVSAKQLHERYSLLDVQLQTGRTHQIRVHLSHVGHPIVGDPIYGTSPRAGLSQAQRQAVLNFNRQALHAHTLGFIHPDTGESMKFTATLPDDMQQLIEVLQHD
ncbi:ribosomal large subunit pseudouridine synthase D [Moraxella cuniculi DSM 21768]|uniref:Pseudouridine synthase n=1 Tax=Moraxella cuniculi DSM 21768 TaxID=1122245 RepID=A0A1N7FU30_9GAMM|nr:RluA family pseudouridine synthase [Moraxella cuniculi]OOS05501.1 RNA pseudouridine synthase [Moraxella cuniculi]SIS03745.1 ribosomal large subunit pseudouridine synthase D [Moraxella cuniculi DSM 21768]